MVMNKNVACLYHGSIARPQGPLTKDRTKIAASRISHQCNPIWIYPKFRKLFTVQQLKHLFALQQCRWELALGRKAIVQRDNGKAKSFY